VPDAVVVPPPIASDTIETPGARMSVVAVWFELAAMTSEVLTDPTAMTFDRQAGSPFCVFGPLFPGGAKQGPCRKQRSGQKSEKKKGAA